MKTKTHRQPMGENRIYLADKSSVRQMAPYQAIFSKAYVGSSFPSALIVISSAMHFLGFFLVWVFFT